MLTLDPTGPQKEISSKLKFFKLCKKKEELKLMNNFVRYQQKGVELCIAE